MYSTPHPPNLSNSNHQIFDNNAPTPRLHQVWKRRNVSFKFFFKIFLSNLKFYFKNWWNLGTMWNDWFEHWKKFRNDFPIKFNFRCLISRVVFVLWSDCPGYLVQKASPCLSKSLERSYRKVYKWFFWVKFDFWYLNRIIEVVFWCGF